MSGAEFFWRITLLEGRGKNSVFRLEEHTEPFGTPRPDNIPYTEKAGRLTYEQLGAAIPYVGDNVAQVACALIPEDPQLEYHYARHMSI